MIEVFLYLYVLSLDNSAAGSTVQHVGIGPFPEALVSGRVGKSAARLECGSFGWQNCASQYLIL